MAISKSKEAWLDTLHSYELFDIEQNHTTELTEACYVSTPWFSHGDYHGSLVQKSNVQVVEEDYPELYDAAIVVNRALCSVTLAFPVFGKHWEQAKELIDSLESYPVLSDEVYSQLETDTAFKAWEQYGYADFMQQFEHVFRRFSVDPETWEDSEQHRQGLLDLWSGLEDVHGGEYFVNEQGDSIHFTFPRESNAHHHFQTVDKALEGYIALTFVSAA